VQTIAQFSICYDCYIYFNFWRRGESIAPYTGNFPAFLFDVSDILTF
jgi:hypothetical protein